MGRPATIKLGPAGRGVSSTARIQLLAAEIGSHHSTIYRDLVADNTRLTQVVDDVITALKRGRHRLVLTQWTTHVERITEQFQRRSLDPVALRGSMSATARRDALVRLRPTDEAPLLVVATGPFVGEGFDCPVLDTLFLAVPIAFNGRLIQYVGRILRTHQGNHSRGPRLPRHQHRSAGLVPGQTRAWLHQPRVPRSPSVTSRVNIEELRSNGAGHPGDVTSIRIF
jgi:hypothetical protein